MKGKSFFAHKQYLEQKGIYWEDADILTGEHWQKNTASLASQISRFQNPILIVSHSMGGVITLHSLLENQYLWPKIRGWVAIQAPFYGTKFADEMKKMGEFGIDKIIDPLGMHRLLPFGKQMVSAGKEARNLILARVFMDVDWDVIASLTTKKRQKLMEKLRPEIELLGREVPILSVMSHGKWKSRPPLAPELSAKSSDGIVTTRSMLFPGSQHIYYDDVDHMSLVISGAKDASWQIDRFLEQLNSFSNAGSHCRNTFLVGS